MDNGGSSKTRDFGVYPSTLESVRSGLALSGGGVRGIAHIGVIKALSELGIQPSCVVGTSVGSLVGVAMASGMDWREILSLAQSVCWPLLLKGKRIERLCCDYFPRTFSALKLPFIAVATESSTNRAVYITSGDIPTAISASCALKPFRRPVDRDGLKLVDGGVSCVLPSLACRTLGADFVIACDVSESSALLRSLGIQPTSLFGFLYAKNYSQALAATDVLVQPRIPLAGYLPGLRGLASMMSAGEMSTLEVVAQ